MSYTIRLDCGHPAPVTIGEGRVDGYGEDFRAVWMAEGLVLLTDETHAHLPDSELLSEAEEEAGRAGLLCDSCLR